MATLGGTGTGAGAGAWGGAWGSVVAWGDAWGVVVTLGYSCGDVWGGVVVNVATLTHFFNFFNWNFSLKKLLSIWKSWSHSRT